MESKAVSITTALKRAGSTALRDMRAEAKKRIREKKNIKAKDVAKAIHIQRPRRVVGGAPASWAVNFSGGIVRLAAYPHRQNKQGVSVKINKGGGATLIKSGFIATMRSGHKGVFVRVKGAGAKGGRRRKSGLVSRLPIRAPFGSRPVDALLQPGRAQLVADRGLKSFMDTFKRLGPGAYEMLPALSKARIE